MHILFISCHGNAYVLELKGCKRVLKEKKLIYTNFVNAKFTFLLCKRAPYLFFSEK